MPRRIRIVDSHTAGEPTRAVVSGGPDLEGANLLEKREDFRRRFDHFRSAIVNEPRGSDVMVGALLTDSPNPACATGVVFFNNVGYLGMCGHGTIGLVATLQYLGRIGSGIHQIDTPVGVVGVTFSDSGKVTFRNVPAYRHLHQISVRVPGCGEVMGDVAWGGNWFFLVEERGRDLSLRNVEALTAYTWDIRRALAESGITGADGREIDHVELFAPSDRPGVNGKNFVLCPGKAYDRSPCGTGTSAKLACLYEDGKLKPGEVWRQESVTGGVFDGVVEVTPEGIVPVITGEAFITSEAELILDESDPLQWGIR